MERLLSLVPASALPALPPTQALVIPVSVQDMPYALWVARAVRTSGMSVEIDVTGHGVGAGLKLATKKHIPLALIVGGNEREESVVTVRNLETGEENVVSIEVLVVQAKEWER
ncbi:MAG TPA: His/Gly/Thr/Pro-type tRNA ligase C-terminal domain-containing protein, partial [Ktedonobacteraceae bacterium]|nr:His/Gly/Thr/Pro-type tRNA ligase C-terminal domain-containing protein [Ktedonobacteraceae bacterium]